MDEDLDESFWSLLFGVPDHHFVQPEEGGLLNAMAIVDQDFCSLGVSVLLLMNPGCRLMIEFVHHIPEAVVLDERQDASASSAMRIWRRKLR